MGLEINPKKCSLISHGYQPNEEMTMKVGAFVGRNGTTAPSDIYPKMSEPIAKYQEDCKNANLPIPVRFQTKLTNYPLERIYKNKKLEVKEGISIEVVE